jgi:hypothetical protein
MVRASDSYESCLSSYNNWQYIKVCFQNDSQRSWPKGLSQNVEIFSLRRGDFDIFECIFRLQNVYDDGI